MSDVAALFVSKPRGGQPIDRSNVCSSVQLNRACYVGERGCVRVTLDRKHEKIGQDPP